MKTLGIKSVKIYSSNGTNVATYSYTADGYEYLMGSDTGRKTASVTYTGTSGKSYYAVVVFYASDGSGGDSRSYTTKTDRKSTRLNSSHKVQSRMPSSA